MPDMSFGPRLHVFFFLHVLLILHPLPTPMPPPHPSLAQNTSRRGVSSFLLPTTPLSPSSLKMWDGGAFPAPTTCGDDKNQPKWWMTVVWTIGMYLFFSSFFIDSHFILLGFLNYVIAPLMAGTKGAQMMKCCLCPGKTFIIFFTILLITFYS